MKDRLNRIQELYHGAMSRESGERRAWLEGECGDRPDLVADVLKLLDVQESVEVQHLDAVIDDQEFPVEATSIPERLGPFRILERVGAGGFGVVFKAEQDYPKRILALKILRFDRFAPRDRARFELEGDLLARLDHASIAKLYEAGVLTTDLGERPYLAIEWIEGLSLDAWKAERECGFEESLHVLLQIMGAVEHAHQRLVLHRDLKPSNILVTPSGTPKVVDFGIGRPLSQRECEHELTRTHETPGSPRYMSPEQAEHDSIDVRTDVFSMGIVSLEVFSGQKVDRRADEGAPRLGSLVKKMKGTDLEAVLAKATDRDRMCRYQSIHAFAEDLRAIGESRPTTARRISLGRRLILQVRRRPRQTLLMIALMILIVGSGWMGLSSYESARASAYENAQLFWTARSRGAWSEAVLFGDLAIDGPMDEREKQSVRIAMLDCDASRGDVQAIRVRLQEEPRLSDDKVAAWHAWLANVDGDPQAFDRWLGVSQSSDRGNRTRMLDALVAESVPESLALLRSDGKPSRESSRYLPSLMDAALGIMNGRPSFDDSSLRFATDPTLPLLKAVALSLSGDVGGVSAACQTMEGAVPEEVIVRLKASLTLGAETLARFGLVEVDDPQWQNRLIEAYSTVMDLWKSHFWMPPHLEALWEDLVSTVRAPSYEVASQSIERLRARLPNNGTVEFLHGVVLHDHAADVMNATGSREEYKKAAAAFLDVLECPSLIDVRFAALQYESLCLSIHLSENAERLTEILNLLIVEDAVPLSFCGLYLNWVVRLAGHQRYQDPSRELALASALESRVHLGRDRGIQMSEDYFRFSRIGLHFLQENYGQCLRACREYVQWKLDNSSPLDGDFRSNVESWTEQSWTKVQEMLEGETSLEDEYFDTLDLLDDLSK